MSDHTRLSMRERLLIFRLDIAYIIAQTVVVLLQNVRANEITFCQ